MLSPIGFDLPQQRPSTLAVPQAMPQADTKGLEIVAQAQQGLAATINSRKQDLQSQAALANDTVQLVAANAAQLAAASTAAARAEAAQASNNAQAWRETSQNLGQLAQFELQRKQLEQQQKDTEERRKAEVLKQLLAERKAQQEANLPKVVTALEKFRDSWIMGDGFTRAGPNAYQDKITEIIANGDVPLEKQDELIRAYFQPAQDYARKNHEESQQYAEETKKAEQRIKSTALQQSLSASLGALNAATGRSDAEISDAYSRVQSQIQDFYQSGGDPLETAQIVAEALAVASNRLSDVNIKTSELRANARQHSEYARFLAEQKAQVSLGQLPASSYEALARQKAAELGVPFYLPDPLADDKATVELLRNRSTIVELQQKQALTAIEQLEATNSTIGSIATSMALSPSVEASIRAQKVLDPNAKQALRIFDEFKDFREREITAIRSEQANLATTLELQKQQLNRWLIDAQNGRSTEMPVLDQLRQQGLGIPVLTQGQAITPEQVKTIFDGFTRIQAARIQEFQVKVDAYRARQQYFANYGLFEDQKETQKAQQAFQKAGEAYRKRLESIRAAELTLPGNLPGQNPNFNGGVPGRPPKPEPLARGKYAGVQVALPFRPQDLGQVQPAFDGQMFGASRDGGARKHQGLDYAVPVGTPFLSLAAGTVIDVRARGNYGNIVEINGDDGRNYFFAHVDKAVVSKGQRVALGQKLGFTGDTGAGGPHLHLEIMENGKHLNPLSATAEARYSLPAAQPRTSTPQPPPTLNGVPIGGDNWLVDGKVVKIDGSSRIPSRGAPANVNSASIYKPAGFQASDNPLANYGYAVLSRDTELARALNSAAKELNIPGQWLADVIAMESAGTFSPSIGNGRGFYGLIQFGEAARQDLGLTTEQLTRMTAAQQMQYVVKYLKLQARYAGVEGYRTIHELAGAVNQGHGMLRDIRRRGVAAVLDPSNRDGAITFRTYINKLGQYVGRRYEADPLKYLRASTLHDQIVGGCPVCANLTRDEFVIHRGAVS